uniref:Bifunctional inhibitor/plant lipid transfer protein/seed storage helical domain-containing protein n=1 Tax=Ananas comosus var. bracteatus TaxID=296719 RepID=A0A6V7Q8Y3_ANACO|nr:unnamed protein product [Ananas comosus var. bracteatus]
MAKRTSYTAAAPLLLLLLLIQLAAVVREAAAAGSGVSCSDAVNKLIPCGSFLVGTGPAKPSARCCQSAQGLQQMATTVAKRARFASAWSSLGRPLGSGPSGQSSCRQPAISNSTYPSALTSTATRYPECLCKATLRIRAINKARK